MPSITVTLIQRPALRYRMLDATALDEETLRAMWRFRLRFVALKPHVAEEQDFASFTAFFRKAHTVVLARDAAGEIQVMLAMAVRLDAGRRERLLVWEYTFFAPEHRRDPRMYAAWWWLIARRVVPSSGWSTWCVAWTYPASYVALRNSLPGIVSLRGPGISEAARGVLTRFGRDVGGASFDEATGVRDMPTIPREPFQVRPGRGAKARAGQEYVEANPRWAEGKTLAVVAPLSLGSLGSIAWAVAQRAFQKANPFRVPARERTT